MTFFSSLCYPKRICIHCRKWYEESFTGIDFSSHIAVSSAQVIYSLFIFHFYSCLFFYLFIYFIVIAYIFFFNSNAWNLLSRILYSVSVSVIPFPDSGFHVLVLPQITRSIMHIENWREVYWWSNKDKQSYYRIMILPFHVCFCFMKLNGICSIRLTDKAFSLPRCHL